ncbi:MAG: hypothetical protein RIS00_1523 [Pseudomonadota bacterium]
MSVSERLEYRRKQRLEMLRADIDERGIDAAIEYGKSRLEMVPKHGMLDGLRETLLDASADLGSLTELQLAELIQRPEYNNQVRSWLAKNLDHNNPVIRAVAAKVLKGELVSSSRSGPKLKADAAYQIATWQIAADLNELGYAMSYGDPSNYGQFTAADVIARIAGVSPSLARNWIASGQKLAMG